jgi:hypothetical protein
MYEVLVKVCTLTGINANTDPQAETCTLWLRGAAPMFSVLTRYFEAHPAIPRATCLNFSAHQRFPEHLDKYWH